MSIVAVSVGRLPLQTNSFDPPRRQRPLLVRKQCASAAAGDAREPPPARVAIRRRCSIEGVGRWLNWRRRHTSRRLHRRFNRPMPLPSRDNPSDAPPDNPPCRFGKQRSAVAFGQDQHCPAGRCDHVSCNVCGPSGSALPGAAVGQMPTCQSPRQCHLMRPSSSTDARCRPPMHESWLAQCHRAAINRLRSQTAHQRRRSQPDDRRAGHVMGCQSGGDRDARRI